MVKNILKLEGLAVFLASLYFFNEISGNWILFVLLIIVPDISMIGYIKDKKLGSITYNLVHNYILALVIIFYGILANNDLVTSFGLILSAHIGADRLVNYGLKYPSDFKDTHINKV